MTTRVVEDMRVATSDAAYDAPEGQPAPLRHCDACGAALQVSMKDEMVPWRWGTVWFCEHCMRALSAAEIDRQTREVTLRGVPLN